MKFELLLIFVNSITKNYQIFFSGAFKYM